MRRLARRFQAELAARRIARRAAAQRPGALRNEAAMPLPSRARAMRGPRPLRQLALAFERELAARWRTEEALRASERRLRQIIDLVPVKIFAKNIDGRFILANRETTAGLGVTPEQIEGKTFAELGIKMPEATDYLRDDREVIESGKMRVIPEEKRTYAGRVAIQRTIKVPFVSSVTGEPASLGVAVDITELKLAERRIELLSRLYATLSEVNEAVARAQSPRELLQEVCRILCERTLFSLTFAVFVDGDDMHVVAAHGATSYLDGIRITLRADAPESRGPLATAVREQRPFVVNDFLGDPATASWRDRAAEIGTRASAGFPLIVRGQAVGALGLHSPTAGFFDRELVELLVRMTDNVAFALDKIAQDALVAQTRDELSRLNQELEQRVRRRTAELESAVREIESFSYSVSHDLRAPVRHIDGFVRLLAEELGDSASAKAKHYLARVAGGAARMGVLIDALLAFSRTSRTVPVIRRVELDALVREVVSELGSEIDGRTIQWRIAPLPAVSADPTLLRLVLQNLIGNAVKYTGKRADAEIEIGAKAGPNGMAIVYVRDNGVGFDMRYRDKLFGVFQRLHRDDEFEGTGIGLATVHRIVARHGGEVAAEAEPGRGAMFSFTIGLAQ